MIFLAAKGLLETFEAHIARIYPPRYTKDTPGIKETVGQKGVANNVNAPTYKEWHKSSSRTGTEKARQTSQVTSLTPSDYIREKLVKRCEDSFGPSYDDWEAPSDDDSKWFISGESDDNRSLSEMDGDGIEQLCDDNCSGRPSRDESWVHLSDYEGREESRDEENGRKCASYTDVQKAVSDTNKFPPVCTPRITMTKTKPNI